MVRTQVYLTEEQARDIKLRAKRENKREAEVIRELVNIGFKASHSQVFHVWRDKLSSITYSEELIFSMSASLQSTDRHHGIVGQEYCHFQRAS